FSNSGRPVATCSSIGIVSRLRLALLEKDVEKRLGSLAMTGRRNNHEQGDSVSGVLLASMFWIVLAHQSYCAGSVADWLHMGDVEECR
ncbi:MAG: hypothetical protein WB803_27650, partial [Pseudolabrys sp.]